MKIKLSLAAAAIVMAGSAVAQSAFQGFYGQIATGYENNSVENTNLAVSQSAIGRFRARSFVDQNGGNATNETVPLIVGVGYTFAINSQFTLGIGADYSTLSSKTNTIQYTTPTIPNRENRINYELSNRYSIYASPGYVIDKDKLAYLKAGYANQKIQQFDGTSGNFEGGANMNGYLLGLGYKQLIKAGFYAFGEANYYSFSNANINFNGSTTAPRIGGTFNQISNPKTTAYNFLVGVGYKF
jgi:outer membrane immunogenic protein